MKHVHYVLSYLCTAQIALYEKQKIRGARVWRDVQFVARGRRQADQRENGRVVGSRRRDDRQALRTRAASVLKRNLVEDDCFCSSTSTSVTLRQKKACLLVASAVENSCRETCRQNVLCSALFHAFHVAVYCEDRQRHDQVSTFLRELADNRAMRYNVDRFC